LRKDKGLRSVINKVIIQINAKVGGIPWVVSNLPFTQKGPCMVIGIDIFSKKSSSGVLGFCASTDKNFSRYASFPKILNSPSDLIAGLKSSTEESLSQFKSDNKVFPSTIIIFRDGISDSQGKTVLLEEIPAFNSAFESFMQKTEKFEMPSLIYVLVNKRTNARFYMKNNGNITNPPLGTVVDSKVVDKNGFDFYVTPAKANQGSMTPTYFNVIFDSSGLPCDQIQMLAYRLCYAYYNWSGSIRVPAPCQYAKKLAYMYGERSDRNGPPRPHDAWAGSRSLYFL
jgi:aubergine-like protein